MKRSEYETSKEQFERSQVRYNSIKPGDLVLQTGLAGIGLDYFAAVAYRVHADDDYLDVLDLSTTPYSCVKAGDFATEAEFMSETRTTPDQMKKIWDKHADQIALPLKEVSLGRD